jgi:hypothetical protein
MTTMMMIIGLFLHFHVFGQILHTYHDELHTLHLILLYNKNVHHVYHYHHRHHHHQAAKRLGLVARSVLNIKI